MNACVQHGTRGDDCGRRCERMTRDWNASREVSHLLAQLATTRQADESARSRLPMGGEGE